MNSKVAENMIVITLILIIGCLLFPIVTRIVYNAQASGAKASVYGSIEAAKLEYAIKSQTNYMTLPFTIEYINNECIAHSTSLYYFIENESKGTKPLSGKIIISSDGVSVVDLTYENFICNKTNIGDVECVRRNT